MTSLANVVKYLAANHPDKDSLSADRLKLIIYLADWKSALERGHQLTDINWEIKHGKLYLPFPSYEKLALPTNIFGYVKYLLSSWFSREGQDSRLTDAEIDILDYAIKNSSEKSWEKLVKLVYSTYPTLAEQSVESLDLSGMASRYRKVLPLVKRSKSAKPAS